jgi:DNA-binding MarR family transcriptional regulator
MTKRSIEPLVAVVGSRLSTATVMFHASVAEKMGLSVSDARARSVIARFGAMTAGQLAAHLRLSSGAVTGVIDRLQAGKWLRRVADPADRRRVVVELLVNRRRDRALASLSTSMGTRIQALAASYGEKDRAVILRFLTRACEILEDETQNLGSR